MPGEMLARPHARGKRAGPDAPGRAMKHRAMRVVAAAIMPALHATLKAFALADPADIHILADLETVDQNAIAGLGLLFRILEPHFAEVSHRRDASLFEVAAQRLGNPLRLNEFHKTQLHRFVPVFVFPTTLHDDAWTGLQHGAGNRRAVIRKNLRHSQLDSQYAVDSHFSHSFITWRRARARRL